VLTRASIPRADDRLYVYIVGKPRVYLFDLKAAAREAWRFPEHDFFSTLFARRQQIVMIWSRGAIGHLCAGLRTRAVTPPDLRTWDRHLAILFAGRKGDHLRIDRGGSQQIMS